MTDCGFGRVDQYMSYCQVLQVISFDKSVQIQLSFRFLFLSFLNLVHAQLAWKIFLKLERRKEIKKILKKIAPKILKILFLLF